MTIVDFPASSLLTLAQAQPGQQSSLFWYGWFGIMIAIFYFILIRPQQRREKERKALLAKVKTGDQVVFAGGLMGIVANVKDNVLSIKIADKVKIEVVRGAVTQVLEKGAEPTVDPAKP